MEIQSVLALVQAFTDHGLTELDVEDNGTKIRLRKDNPGVETAASYGESKRTVQAGAAGFGAAESVGVIPASMGAIPGAPGNVSGIGGTPGNVSVIPGAAGTAAVVSGAGALAAGGAAAAAIPAAGVLGTGAVVQTVAAVPGQAAAGPTAMESDKVVVSPLVGVFYSASSPDAENFVKVGDVVKKGQVLGIIEAMKLMNEIESEYDGVVEAILVNNEDVVEYNQPLFRIR